MFNGTGKLNGDIAKKNILSIYRHAYCGLGDVSGDVMVVTNPLFDWLTTVTVCGWCWKRKETENSLQISNIAIVLINKGKKEYLHVNGSHLPFAAVAIPTQRL